MKYEINGSEIARGLVKILGEKNIPSIVSYFNQIRRGIRSLSVKYEQALLEVTGCKNREEIRRLFPEIRFHGEKKQDLNILGKLCEVEIKIEQSVCQIAEGDLPVLFRTIFALDALGIKAEVHVRPKK